MISVSVLKSVTLHSQSSTFIQTNHTCCQVKTHVGDMHYMLHLLTILVLSSQAAMANLKLARLKVISGENNIEKLALSKGIPESLDELLSQIKTTFELKEDFRL